MNRKKTDFVWNGQNLASETTNDVTTVYDYDLTGIIASTVNGEVTKYVKDPHGNVVVTSRNGSIAGEYDYSAFGEQLTATDTTNPFRYCGEYYDNENGLTYLRNRYYDSNTGRFLSEDPIKDGMNWYSYCGDDPVNAWDPIGLVDIPEDGTKPYNELIDALVELIDAKTNYINEDSKGNRKNKNLLEKYHKQADHIRNNKIKLNSALWYSNALNDVINKVVLDSDNAGSVQELSSVIALLNELRSNIVNKASAKVGDEIMSEDDVWERYMHYRTSNKVYIPVTSGYPIHGGELAEKILSKGARYDFFLGLTYYRGFNGYGVYYDIKILASGVDDYSDTEDWPH